MSKYTYKKVEHINDIDLTGETSYYYWDDSTPHKLIDILNKNITDLHLWISGRNLYTRKEKLWYEDIPEHGVLCWVGDTDIEVIYNIGGVSRFPFVLDEDGYELEVIPLTDDEIKKFLRGDNEY